MSLRLPLLRDLPPGTLRWEAAAVLLLGLATPIHIGTSEGALFLAVAVWAVRRVRGEAVVRADHPLVVAAVLFSVTAALASLGGQRPVDSMRSFHRLLMPLALLPIADAVRAAGPHRRRLLRATVAAWLLGSGILAAYDLVRVPLFVLRGGNPYDAGNMRDPQFYLVSLCLLTAWPRRRPDRKALAGHLGLLALQGLGMVLHFKRGVMLAFAAVLTGFAVIQRRWKVLAVLAAGALALAALPVTRQRFEALRLERGERLAGRYVLWTKVAPAALAEHPWGFGYRVVRHEDLLQWSTRIQPDLNHLHNNALQVALETGWAGLGVWLVWMAVAGTAMVRGVRRARDPEARALAWGVLAAFVALHVNGLVEYNFGHTPIIITFAILTGWAAAVAD